MPRYKIARTAAPITSKQHQQLKKQQRQVGTSPAVCCAALISTSISSRCVHHAHFSALLQTTVINSCKAPQNVHVQFHATAFCIIAYGVERYCRKRRWKTNRQTCRLSMSVLNLSLSRTCSSCLAWACTKAEGWLRRASSLACSCSFACTQDNNQHDIQMHAPCLPTCKCLAPCYR